MQGTRVISYPWTWVVSDYKWIKQVKKHVQTVHNRVQLCKRYSILNFLIDFV